MSEWYDVGAIAALERDGRLIARLGGREVGVVLDRERGSVHGVRDRCPHHGGRLCLGTVRERLEGVPGRYTLGGRRVLRCPWHGCEFDLETGRCLDEPSLRAAVYPVELVDGRVRLRAWASRGRPRGGAPARSSPCTRMRARPP